MKHLALLLSLVLLACTAASAAPGDKKPFVMYAQLLDAKEVHLSDGSIWMMDKGDCFPIHMFKEKQTIVVLQIASAQFAVEGYHVRVMKDGEAKDAEANYRKNVDNYWKAVAKRPKTPEAPAAAPAK